MGEDARKVGLSNLEIKGPPFYNIIKILGVLTLIKIVLTNYINVIV